MENKPRLYFSDPIVALYMMKEFGVDLQFKKPFDNRSGERFIELGDLWISDVDCTNHDEFRLVSLLSANDIPRIYVSPKSKSIFDPQEGDRGTHAKLKDDEFFFWHRRNNIWIASNSANAAFDKHISIVMRGNRLFFDALREENDNS